MGEITEVGLDLARNVLQAHGVDDEGNIIVRAAVLRSARQSNPGKVWAGRLLERKRPKVVAVALANKTAWIAWALMACGATYMAPAA